ncbi:hypothetical protein [Yoonia sediminilitoris]|uniref:Carbohydrate binding protein n=1 Tax=Yoonia sediminilitoris TaxID=1286148 RepID=A0A2T6KB75_9RHOB|nr:hypothetical protein [Yoonia sediminilitoris]PUB12122.1 hypothetical protein C8N45_11199 [Yoonia sediminilitoris]RCW92949.1 hypothetical protein DFP92_11198 [Yoonia sediminilitoris]
MLGLGLGSLTSRAQGQDGGVGHTAPLAEFFVSGGGQRVALAQGVDANLSIFTEISPTHVVWMELDNNNPATRLSWRETLVAELRNIYTVRELTLSSGWSQLQSSGSGLSGSYIGNRAISTSSATATADVIVGRADPYDVWIYYTGRTNGGYARVDIDGDQVLVNELTDPDAVGFKAFSTFSATDLQRRISVKIASGLTGDHVVTISNGGTATPGGGNILIEAVAITGNLAGPQVLPPLWQPGTTYEMGDEVQFGGRYYAARANGQSGVVGPTHVSGIASDGALDWRVDHRPTYPKFVSIDYASEREYAASVTSGGASTVLGGQTHGFDALDSRTIELDGAPWVPVTTGNGLSVGTQANLVEQTKWRSSTGVDLADCTLSRAITPGTVSHGVAVTGTGPDVNFDWLYAGMLPLVAWDGESRRTIAQTVTAAGYAPVVMDDYAGVNPPNIDFAGADRLGIAATVADDTLIYGHEAGATLVAGNIVNQFDTFLRPNLNATVKGGSLDWQAKAYITGSAAGGLQLGSGDALGFFSRHVMRVETGTT